MWFNYSQLPSSVLQSRDVCEGKTQCPVVAWCVLEPESARTGSEPYNCPREAKMRDLRSIGISTVKVLLSYTWLASKTSRLACTDSRTLEIWRFWTNQRTSGEQTEFHTCCHFSRSCRSALASAKTNGAFASILCTFQKRCPNGF